MRKRRLFSSAILVVFVAASIVITACNGPNNPKPSASNPEKILETNVFPKAPDGKTYDGYKITWTDVQGNVQTKTVTMDEVKNGVVLPGGLKEGTQPNVVPLVKNADGTVTEDSNAGQNVTPSPSVDWKPSIQAGIAELEKEHPDFDAALAKFKDAYNAERNNTTKAYYAAAQLAYISVKPETVNFMRNKMGFATYPGKLNALVNLEWFEKYTEQYLNPDGTTSERIFRFPKMKAAADWYKDFAPSFQIPAYLIEHSDSANVDQLIDELYGILFGTEFITASNLLNSLDAAKPITIDKKLIKVLHMDDGIFDADSDVELQKDQLLGIIGGLTVTKGVMELLQSYSFNTDLNILKWNWEKEAEALKDLSAYNAQQDPFNNGFLKGRSQQKIIDAKNNIVKGADLLLASYKSLTDSATLPADVKAKVKEHTEPIQRIVQEIRDAVDEARTANLLVGTHNPMKDGFQVFTIDMGKVFKYEYFELAKLFDMNGSKPKIYPADGTSSTPYMNLTVKRFMNDFVTIKLKDGREVFEDLRIPLDGTAGTKIINFYN